jgi:type 1 glutamine amidotransferase
MQKLIILTALAIVHLATAADAPIKALIIGGGCCHDYKNQSTILIEGIQARTAADITIASQSPKEARAVLSQPNWADGYDVVIYNFCDAGEKDSAYIDAVVKTHTEGGVGAVMIHCALHSYHWNVGAGRKDFANKNWVKMLGIGSRGHGPHKPITVTTEAAAKDHPIMKGIPAEWTTPKGELYYSDYIAPTSTILAKGTNDGGKNVQAVVWTNETGKAKVFGTSLGHHNETMLEKAYLDMVTNGLLWATGRLK